jgi:hypothetical protein
MKIAITGHTKGLGKFLYDYYSDSGHQVIGFSKSTGYDINTDIDKIIDESKNVDLFINNAYSGIQQAKITEKILGKINFLVVSGSDAVTVPNINCSHHADYISNKTEVSESCRLASMANTKTNVLHLKIPFMENSTSSAELKISFLEIAKTIDFWLTCPNINEVRYQWKLTDNVYKELEHLNKPNHVPLISLKEKIVKLSK